jgi:hypothetical protein
MPRLSKKAQEEARGALVDRARDLHQDEGTIEIDDGALVSRAARNPNKGAYVQAWVWVPDADCEE